MIELHYGKKAFGSEIVKTIHEAIIPLVKSIINNKTDGETVYLLSFYDEYNEKDLIFVSEHFDFIIDILRNTHTSFDSNFAKKIHIFETDSYKEAYKMSINMMEENQLCCSKDVPTTDIIKLKNRLDGNEDIFQNN